MNISSLRLGAIGFIAISLAGLAATAGMANSATAATVQCGIAKTSEGGMLAIEGAILSPVALTGEYRFSIRSASNGGSSNISQGGYFTAKANEATPLGTVMVNAGSSVYIDFDVTANGQKLNCGKDLASIR